MNLIVIFSPFLLIASSGNFTQWEQCEIPLNKRMVLKGTTPKGAEIITLSSNNIKANNCLTNTYKTAETKSDCKRIFYINNSNDLFTKQAELKDYRRTICIKASEIAEQIKTKHPLSKYTTSLTANPSIAGTIRAKRILLCSIEWS